jgi:hypothetical protein
MMTFTIILFALAAVLGLTILVKWLTNKEASRGVVYAHGAAAAVALVLLLVYVLQHPDNSPMTSLILFVIAALGGFYMFFKDVKGQNSPMGIAIVHALLAVGGFVTLLLFAFT